MQKKRRSKHENTSAATRVTGADSSQLPHHPHQRRFSRHLLVGLLLTILAWCLSFWVENKHFYIDTLAKELVYDLLQHRLGAGVKEVTDIAVVDISTIPMVRTDNRNLDYTDRDALQKVVDTIADQSPHAIGIDVDFTPYPAQADRDDQFLSHCQTLTQRSPPVPVFVTVFTSLVLGPDSCLEEPAFAQFATFAGAPKPAENESPHMMVETIDITYGVPGAAPWAVRSLAAAMAGATVKQLPWSKSWALEDVVVVQGAEFDATEFYVDFGALDTLQQPSNTIPYDQVDQPKYANFFRGKYVLIGRAIAETSIDQHIVPGRYDRTYSGVYLHACALYTLLSGRPLSLMRAPAKLVLDIFLSLVILTLVEFANWVAIRIFGPVAKTGFADMFITVAVLIGAVVCGIYAVSLFRVMWTDSLFVAAADLVSHVSSDLVSHFSPNV